MRQMISLMLVMMKAMLLMLMMSVGRVLRMIAEKKIRNIYDEE